MDLQSIARALGGEVHGDHVSAPGPGHSAKDRSLSVWLTDDGQDIRVHSFAGDDPIVSRDYVRPLMGMAPFESKGRAAATTYTYEYRTPEGKLAYRKMRKEPVNGKKTFYFEEPSRNGGPPLLYGGEYLASLSEDDPVWIVEGEKKVNRLRELGAVAVSGDTGDTSKWLPHHVNALRGLRIILWPDSDEPGEKYIANAATAILAASPAADIRVVRPFGLPNGMKGRDVCDWEGTAERLPELIESATPYLPTAAAAAKQAPGLFCAFNPVNWEGQKAPARKWDVPNYIPHGVVALLYADGGTGKGYLGLQLAVARATAKEWIGLSPEPGRTLVVSTEDDLDEMWRRIEGMLPFFDAGMSDLGDIRLVDLAAEETPVLGLFSNGLIQPTAMYQALDAYIGDFKPGMVVLDVLADLFAGDEIARNQATQFIRILKRLCRKHETTVLLCAQPSLTGLNTGSGTSGSTGWTNSGRARMYFNRVKSQDGTEPNKDLRTFQGMKNNYGELGGKFDLLFENGLFRRLAGPTGFGKIARDQKIDDMFISLLKRLTLQKRSVRATNSRAGAGAVFGSEPDNGGFSIKDFEMAMARLLENGKIANEMETEGAPSRRKLHLVVKEGKNGRN